MSNDTWRQSLIAIRADFDAAARMFPDLRCAVVKYQHAELNRDDVIELMRAAKYRLDEAIKLELDSRRVSHSWGLVHSFQDIKTTQRWDIAICGDRAGAHRFSELAAAAAGCLKPNWNLITAMESVCQSPDLQDASDWMRAIFYVAWQRVSGSALHAKQLLHDKRRNALVTSVLPVNPFLASALLIDLLLTKALGWQLELMQGTNKAAPESPVGKQLAAARMYKGKMTCRQLAEEFGITRQLDALRKRLERWRKGNDAGWSQISDATSREAKYVYEVKAVQPIIDSLKQASARPPHVKRNESLTQKPL